MFTAQAALKIQSCGTLLSSKKFTGATRQELQSSAEHWAQETLHDLGYQAIPYADGYWLRDRTLKYYSWGNIIFTLELMEGM